MRSFIIASGLLAAVQAFTTPTTATWGPLTAPSLSSPVTQGETFTVTWDSAGHSDATVSLVLCRGPGSNCVTDSTAIVEKVPASANSYAWSVPCSLAAGEASTATGYGMLVIVDGTGEFQYSTQFSVLAGKSCGSTSSSASVSSASASASSSGEGSGSWTTKGGPPNYGSWYSGNGTASWTSMTSAVPTSVVYATSTPVFSFAASSAQPTVTFSAPSAASTFTGGAAMPTNAANMLGLVAGGVVAVLAL